MTKPVAFSFQRAADVARVSLTVIEAAVEAGELRAENAGPSRVIAVSEFGRWLTAKLNAEQGGKRLVELAKQAAAKAGQPVVDHGSGIVGLARKTAAEYSRKQK